jgi:hypothetical protein
MQDFADFSGRKYPYSIVCMVICDDNQKTLAYLAGWPGGSCHNDRVLKKMKVFNLPPEVHISLQQYLLGDSAFKNRWFLLVSAYNKPSGGTHIPHEYEVFNM